MRAPHADPGSGKGKACFFCHREPPTKTSVSKLGCHYCYETFRSQLTELARIFQGRDCHQESLAPAPGEAIHFEALLQATLDSGTWISDGSLGVQSLIRTRFGERLKNVHRLIGFRNQFTARNQRKTLPRASWLKKSHLQHDVVVSTRIRLARNIEGFAFPSAAGSLDMLTVRDLVISTIKAIRPKWHFAIFDYDSRLATKLREQHLLSAEFSEYTPGHLLCVCPEGKLSIMVNEEDHLRLQVVLPGYELQEGLQSLLKLDREISEYLPYARDKQFGLLTSCLTNLGSGLRASLFVHLPAINWQKELNHVQNQLQDHNMTIRGPAGEHSRIETSLFQISNSLTLGRSPMEFCAGLEKMITKIIHWERDRRQRLLLSNNYHSLINIGERLLSEIRSRDGIFPPDRLRYISGLRFLSSLGLLRGMGPGQILSVHSATGEGHLKVERQYMDDEQLRALQVERLQVAFAKVSLAQVDNEGRRVLGEKLYKKGGFPCSPAFADWRNSMMRTGEIEPLQMGMSQDDVREHLGFEDDVGTHEFLQTEILTYGLIDFHFDQNGLRKVWSETPAGEVLCSFDRESQ